MTEYSTDGVKCGLLIRSGVVTFFALLMLFVASCSASSRNPEKVAASFFAYWGAEDYEGMYSLLDEASRGKFDQDYFVARYSNISSGIGLLTVQGEILEEVEQSQDRLELAFSALLKTYTVGDIPIRNVMILTREGRGSPWQITWDPSLIFPELTGKRKVEISRQFPQRGQIYDRNGQLLAGYRTFKEVGVVHGRYPDRSALISALSPLLGLSRDELEKKLTQTWIQEGFFVPLTVLSPEQEELVPQLLQIQGVMLNNVERRYYAGGEALGHLLGYLGEITAEELAERRVDGYYSGDTLGKAGLEKSLEDTLAGTIGFTLRILEEDGSPVAVIARREKRDGEDITLAIDLELQLAVLEAFEEKIGAVVALDPVTGDVLALASRPGFDPNWFVGGISASLWQELMDHPQRPMLNRALSGLYPPGSVFKAYTAAAALQEEKLEPERRVSIHGETYQASASWGGYAVRRVRTDITNLNLNEAMKYSDNIYFAQAGLELGGPQFEKYAAAFGFGETIPFLLPVAVSRLSRNGISSEVLLADSSFGQGEILMTPLHMALLYSVFASGGDIPLPRLSLSGDVEPELWKTAVSSTAARRVHESLVYTINSDNAPAAGGAVAEFTTAGKTGTAQVDTIDGNICWYVTYAPATSPRIVVAVMTEGGVWASEEALPIGRAVLEAFLLRE